MKSWSQNDGYIVSSQPVGKQYTYGKGMAVIWSEQLQVTTDKSIGVRHKVSLLVEEYKKTYPVSVILDVSVSNVQPFWKRAHEKRNPQDSAGA